MLILKCRANTEQFTCRHCTQSLINVVSVSAYDATNTANSGGMPPPMPVPVRVVGAYGDDSIMHTDST